VKGGFYSLFRDGKGGKSSRCRLFGFLEGGGGGLFSSREMAMAEKEDKRKSSEKKEGEATGAMHHNSYGRKRNKKKEKKKDQRHNTTEEEKEEGGVFARTLKGEKNQDFRKEVKEGERELPQAKAGGREKIPSLATNKRKKEKEAYQRHETLKKNQVGTEKEGGTY